jgi:hypothetical protein
MFVLRAYYYNSKNYMVLNSIFNGAFYLEPSTRLIYISIVRPCAEVG